MLGPTLQGEKIRLEPLSEEHLKVVVQQLTDLETLQLAGDRFPRSVQAAEAHFKSVSESEERVAWAIVAEDRPVGTTSFRSIDWVSRNAVSGLTITDLSARGKGYASEAVGLRTRYAFEELGLQRLESESLVQNIAMHKALERSGYTNVGRKRRFMYFAGAYHDSFIFELLDDDWRRLQDTAQQ